MGISHPFPAQVDGLWDSYVAAACAARAEARRTFVRRLEDGASSSEEEEEEETFAPTSYWECFDGDTGLVYDNARGGAACEDTYLRVGAGCAHLSPVPFAGYHPWGAWRNRRSFVGRLGYGVKHLLWQPEKDIHRAFPASFHSMVLTLLMARNRNDNYLADLPEDILFYILHMCHSKWAPPLPKPTMLTALADAKSTQLVKKKATSFVRSVRKSIAGLFRRKSTTVPAPAAD